MGTTMYRGSLPHWRVTGATYFCTWRVERGVACLLPEERAVICAALNHFDGDRYAMHAFVVMNDHVHALVTPSHDVVLAKLLHSWKSFTARELQRSFGRRGSLWQREYFDRIVRDEQDFIAIAHYIENNPRKRWSDLDGPYPWMKR